MEIMNLKNCELYLTTQSGSHYYLDTGKMFLFNQDNGMRTDISDFRFDEDNRLQFAEAATGRLMQTSPIVSIGGDITWRIKTKNNIYEMDMKNMTVTGGVLGNDKLSFDTYEVDLNTHRYSFYKDNKMVMRTSPVMDEELAIGKPNGIEKTRAVQQMAFVR